MQNNGHQDDWQKRNNGNQVPKKSTYLEQARHHRGSFDSGNGRRGRRADCDTWGEGLASGEILGDYRKENDMTSVSQGEKRKRKTEGERIISQ
jgi:hypothetical protein